MSGHSKWAQIKRQKAVTDKKKGNVFTKLGNAVTIAARKGGSDPDSNFQLRLAVEKARAANMPNENIERAIKRGSGELEGAALEEIVYEGFGPAGTAIIIEATTDNKNRTTSVLRNILTKHQGNLGSSGSVMWMFAKKGVIRLLKNHVKNPEEFELKIIDAGAEDIAEEEDGFTILTTPEGFPSVKKKLEELSINVESSEIEYVPSNRVSLPDEASKAKINNLLEELEAADDINNFYTNADL